MSNHTLSNYDQQLSKLTKSILQMGALVRTLIQNSAIALLTKDTALVEFAVNTDKQINELDFEIENMATVVLALQNPMAIDLRFVTSALKIANMLEQCGDLAKNITKRSQKMGNYTAKQIEAPLHEMVGIVLNMLDGALDSIDKRDPKKAIQVWVQDDGVDELYHQILGTMQQEMQKHPDHVEACTHVVFAAKNFERIADYATSMAKTVYYVTSGEVASKAALRKAIEELKE
jgi:phosphate transport system protein